MDTRFTRHDMTLGNYGDGDLKEVAHRYDVLIPLDDDPMGEKMGLPINFQKGALNVPGSTPGIFNEDLALILYHRHLCFAKTKFCSDGLAKESNDKMIKALEDYMGACFGRRMERVFRDVSGTHEV